MSNQSSYTTWQLPDFTSDPLREEEEDGDGEDGHVVR
jgi:hypothetical protein